MATRRPRRFRVVSSVVGFVLFLPVLLSPCHPVAVYHYLADTYVPLFLSAERRAADADLSAFLISPAEIIRYRRGLREDMMDTRGGHIFAIVRRPDGTLRHEPIRTWNSFLPERLPDVLSNWLDRKEIPFLGDTVALWLEDNEIVAMGHYHPFGGGPSPGDHHAQAMSIFSEVVVSNGIVPLVYVHGEVIPYGEDVVIANDLYRSIRALEKGLLMDLNEIPISPKVPSVRLASFLAYLRDYRGTDLESKESVADELEALCEEFKQEYALVFDAGFHVNDYKSDPDKYGVLRNLTNLQYWASRITDFQRRAAREDQRTVKGLS